MKLQWTTAFLSLLGTTPQALADNEFFARGNWQDPGIEYRIKMQPVHEGEVVGELYLPRDANHLPALLVLGACTQGGPRGLGQGMADHGYVALTLFYCGPDTSRPLLQEIPLEIFKSALDWLRKQPSVDPDRIGILGQSAGAAAVLLAAATYPQIKAVVAVAPASVVWQAPVVGEKPRSMFMLAGIPLPYLPVDISVPADVRVNRMKDILPGADSNSDTVISVEKIKAPMLLISGDDDGAWPSALMANRIAARLNAKDFAYPYESLNYTDAGHGFFAAHDSEGPWFEKLYARLIAAATDNGGTTAGNEVAQKDSWAKTLEFLHKYL